MRRRETAVTTMYDGIAAFLSTNKDVFINYSRLNKEIATLAQLLFVLKPLIAKQANTTNGITANKTLALANLCDLVVSMASKAFIYANDNNNFALAATFKVTASDFTYQSELKKLIQAKIIFDTIETKMTDRPAYNILDTDMTALANSIIACQNHIILPKMAKDEKKLATMSIKRTMVFIQASIGIIDKLITSEYAKSNPKLLNEYLITRHVDGRGIRYTGISATFTNVATGITIENAVITIPILTKKAISNINGLAEIIKMKVGTYHVHFSASGYVSQILDMKINRGRVVKIAVEMVVE